MARKAVAKSIRVVRFAQAAWQVGDIKTLRPKWSDERCADFLILNSRHIEDAMVQAGWIAIETLLNEEEE
jgi:hypothetical protein